jgi:NAD(P)H-hydrate epimerase
MNAMQAFRLAVDAPTGLDSDAGKVLGEAVTADLTITFHRAKPGLLNAKTVVGELVVEDIGVPRSIEQFAGPGDVELVVKPRPAESHKGDFGKLLIVGGSEVYSGAPALVALAALRAGVDLTYVATPEKTGQAIASMNPNLITIKLKGPRVSRKHLLQLKPYLSRVTAAIIGPGLGLHEKTQEAVGELLVATEAADMPLLLDADGLKALAKFQHSLREQPVLTPHAGEYAILTGEELPSNLDERIEKVKKTAAKLNAVLLVKGKTDIVSDGQKVKVNFTGNPAMTVGGTGDVLSGVVGAFLAQGADPFEAAVAGAFINGAAGDFVQHEKGNHMMATDLLDWIPRVIDDPMMHLKVRKSAR